MHLPMWNVQANVSRGQLVCVANLCLHLNYVDVIFLVRDKRYYLCQIYSCRWKVPVPAAHIGCSTAILFWASIFEGIELLIETAERKSLSL